MPEVGNKRCARIDGQKDLFQDRIRHRDAIVGTVFSVLLVQGEVERRECKLASIISAGISQLGVIHLFNYFPWNLFRWVAVVGRKRVENLFVPNPILQHLRRRLDEITGYMCSGEAAVFRTSNNRMESVAEFVK